MHHVTETRVLDVSLNDKSQQLYLIWKKTMECSLPNGKWYPANWGDGAHLSCFGSVQAQFYVNY